MSKSRLCQCILVVDLLVWANFVLHKNHHTDLDFYIFPEKIVSKSAFHCIFVLCVFLVLNPETRTNSLCIAIAQGKIHVNMSCFKVARSLCMRTGARLNRTSLAQILTDPVLRLFKKSNQSHRAHSTETWLRVAPLSQETRAGVCAGTVHHRKGDTRHPHARARGPPWSRDSRLLSMFTRDCGFGFGKEPCQESMWGGGQVLCSWLGHYASGAMQSYYWSGEAGESANTWGRASTHSERMTGEDAIGRWNPEGVKEKPAGGWTLNTHVV